MIPAACTTAAAVRREAVEPAMDAIARCHRRVELLRELAELTEQDAADLRRVAGFTNIAAERLDHAERQGDYEAVQIVSEMPSARGVAQRINTAIDTLKHGPDRTAQDNLHAIFETFGADLFEQRFLYHVGVKRTLTLRGEFDRWQAGQVTA